MEDGLWRSNRAELKSNRAPPQEQESEVDPTLWNECELGTPVMRTGFDQIRLQIRDAARAVFAEVQQQHPDEEFYAFALYTDGDAITVCPAANSEEALQRKVNQRNESDPAELRYLRWAIAEWEYETAGAERFQTVCDQLRECRLQGDMTKDITAFSRQLQATMISALRDLDMESLFGSANRRDKVVLFVSTSDSADAQQVETQSAHKLNPQPVYRRFRNRYQV